jgi:hypothetical protein
MFDYNPEDATSCLPEGEATLAIKSCEDKTSRAGNDMIVVTFEAFSGDRKGLITEYVVNPSTLFKLKQIATALGPAALAEFNTGKFDPAKHVGETLSAIIAIESQEGFDDKNKVKKYLPKSAGVPAPSPKAQDDVNAADCPF